MDRKYIVGWDIGGAHLKAAIIDDQSPIRLLQIACPLWRGIDQLGQAIDQVLCHVSDSHSDHAVTMTGEMADLFADRDEGVSRILETLDEKIDRHALNVFVAGQGLLPSAAIHSDHFGAIASANWLATASYAAESIISGLVIDVGSTTTDVLLIDEGMAKPVGRNDYERLVSNELVYSGVVRTPVATLAEEVYFEGLRVPMMAELFATTADVYRLTGELEWDQDLWPAADGGEKSAIGSARRLARMLGRDFDSAPLRHWKKLAIDLRERQLRRIQNACHRQLSRMQPDAKPVLIGAGVGRFLVTDLATRLNLEYRDFAAVTDQPGESPEISDYAPAVSVALMLGSSLRRER